MAGYPKEFEVRTRNRPDANQPGGLMKPEQTEVTEFTFDFPTSVHMSALADAIRHSPPPEPDYEEANFADYLDTPTFEDLPDDAA